MNSRIERVNFCGLVALGFHSDASGSTEDNLINVVKMIKGFEKATVRKQFPLLGNSEQKIHNLKIRTWPLKMEIRKYFFIQRAGYASRSLVTGLIGVFKTKNC